MKKISPLSLLVFTWIVVSNSYAYPELKFSDQRGDDNGAGNLTYPERYDINRGDLDLLEIDVKPVDDGIWFKAKFQKPIRNPAQARTNVGSESLSTFYRKGFFAFNIDIYIDKDRLQGSGNNFTLPGRHARISPENAWEKAIVLSPQPEFINSMLISGLSKNFKNIELSEIRSKVASKVFFAKKIRVRNRVIEFFVPSAFMGEGNPENWAYHIFVTGAKTSHGLRADGFIQDKLESMDLGVMQPVVGQPLLTFGINNGQLSVLPIVDLVTESPGGQLKQLQQGKEAKLIAVSKQEGVVDSSVQVQLNNSFLNWFELEHAVTGDPVQKNIPHSIKTPTVDELQVVKDRLKNLDILLQQNVISEKEYQEQRNRILSEL